MPSGRVSSQHTGSFQMTTIKQSTIEAIHDSKNILVNFCKYGTHTGAKTKISMTFHDTTYAYTVSCYAVISHQKYLSLHSYNDIVELLKPTEYDAVMTHKETGEDCIHSNPSKVKELFKVLCSELAERTDSVYLDMYQSFSKKPKAL
jgi:hypothetical protein